MQRKNNVDNLIPLNTARQIPTTIRKTPIAELIRYHNFKQSMKKYTQAQLLIGMCMDHRKQLRIPENFAYIIRTGGANLRYSEFKVSYAIGVGGVHHIALIGHSQCGMVNLLARREIFIKGLAESAGWDLKSAEEHFHHYAPMFEIGNASAFVVSETQRLRLRYPKITVFPFLYRVEDNRLYGLKIE